MGRDCGEGPRSLRLELRSSSIVPRHSSSSFLLFQDQERRTPLHAAAYVGDVPILQLLLMSGESVELEGVASREGSRGEESFFIFKD